MIAYNKDGYPKLLFYGLEIKDAVKKIYKECKNSSTRGLSERQIQTLILQWILHLI